MQAGTSSLLRPRNETMAKASCVSISKTGSRFMTPAESHSAQCWTSTEQGTASWSKWLKPRFA
jgi:hypothetical protein